jgi:hypothetical protein
VSPLTSQDVAVQGVRGRAVGCVDGLSFLGGALDEIFTTSLLRARVPWPDETAAFKSAKSLFLFLYDAWDDEYRREFADANVKVERTRKREHVQRLDVALSVRRGYDGGTGSPADDRSPDGHHASLRTSNDAKNCPVPLGATAS